MASFIGSMDEFNYYLGPIIRNKIQSKTKPMKKALKHICEDCGEYRELEAVHDKGKSRLGITFDMLDKYGKLDRVNIHDLDKAIHEIIRKNLKYINRYYCHKCHSEYDPKVGPYSRAIHPSHGKGRKTRGRL